MKRTHRADLLCWSRFDEARDIDFNSYAWLRPEGTVLIDPLPLSDHDRRDLEARGPVAHIVITNSDHVRDAAALAERYRAAVVGPEGERDRLGVRCDRWIASGEILPGLLAIALEGSKTPGELALVLEETTLITGDLLRAHAGGSLHLLPPDKLADAAKARESVRALLAHPRIDAVLVGDGWPLFRGARAQLEELVRSFG